MRAVGEQLVDLLGREARQQAAVLVQHARRIGQQDQLLGPQDLRQLAGHQIGVDVVAAAVGSHADRRDDRDELARLQQRDDLRVDAGDLAHLPDVQHLRRRCPCPAAASSAPG